MSYIPVAAMRKMLLSLFPLFVLFFVVMLLHNPCQAISSVPGKTILAPGDTILLKLTNHPLLKQFAGTYIITPRGTISLPDIGEVQASGKTTSSLSATLRKVFHSVTSIDSKAAISLLRQQRFVILGKGVRYPGWYLVPLRPAIDELTALASGLIPGASTEHAKISRKTNNKTREIPYSKALPLRSFDQLVLDVKTNEAIVDNGDLLYVVIPREVTSEFSPTERNYFKEKVEVDRHGFIFLPSQGNIRISGLTTAKISEMLTNNLPKYLSKSDKASVNLIEKRHYIQILGNVETPGWYNIPESANIQAILSQADGTLEGSDLAKITITRKENDGEKHTMQADVQYYLSTGDSRMLPVLHENDTIFVPLAPITEEEDAEQNIQPDSNIPTVRIFGAVNTPGIYPAPRGLSLLDLLITAQGAAPDADLTKIKIMRADGGRETFNLQALLDSDTAEKTAFPMIKGGDIVHIATREAREVNPETGQAMPEQTVTITGPGSATPGPTPFVSPMMLAPANPRPAPRR